MNSDTNFFLCPECNSHKVKEKFNYKNKTGDELYSSVIYEIQCGSCFMDIPGHLGERLNNITLDEAKKQWINIYKPRHLKDAAKCSICDLYYYEIEKKIDLSLEKNKSIFMQKFTQTSSSNLICIICEPSSFK